MAFLNRLPIGFWDTPAAGGGGTASVSIPSGTTRAASTGTTLSGTLDFGTADAARSIVLGCVSNEFGTLRTVSSVSIGGVTASFMAAVTVSTARRLEFWGADVPTGTSGTVSVTWSGSSAGIGHMLWRCIDLDISSIHDTDSAQTGTSPHSGTINCTAGGVVFAIQNIGSGSAGDSTWSGVDDAIHSQFGIGSGRWGAGNAEAFASAQSSLAVTNSWTNPSSFDEGTLWMAVDAA